MNEFVCIDHWQTGEIDQAGDSQNEVGLVHTLRNRKNIFLFLLFVCFLFSTSKY